MEAKLFINPSLVKNIFVDYALESGARGCVVG
jgi:hypothetical protein